ncbi:hypothetical protein NDN08_004993 [Rhodosorus marinus]|uniref:Uncharacterized protein n=1 Tax=Rhodosorus marinus TaxID=101924 RepID=A0AAV8UJA6_9RHOD|nr:hypothetical protein NDN08_004993 [Rhodosorus marinus]
MTGQSVDLMESFEEMIRKQMLGDRFISEELDQLEVKLNEGLQTVIQVEADAVVELDKASFKALETIKNLGSSLDRSDRRITRIDRDVQTCA